ncbi:MAG TPA: EAL domain-containing protein [Burkholderiaceae bacterium]|nr:EAL domain-containing protein [Burkholderiaceae bacterium]
MAPLLATAPPPLGSREDSRTPLRRAHDCGVLLVDDDGVARLLTASALAERGFRVTEAASGSAALELFASEMPDIVVLDALMPELDGFATCERLRRLPGGEHVPVLMLTGLDDETSIARAYEAGATDFFVKTNSQWTLLAERLRYLLRSARMRKELAASQAKLTRAQRIARLGSWVWDLVGRWVTLSDECYTIAGLTRQEQGVADWFVWSRVLEEDRARIVDLFREALVTRKPLDFETRLVRPNNQVRTVHVEAEMEFDDAGRAIAMHGVVQDITERRQAEDQIRQLANFDSLTGLPNRRFFRDQLATSIDRAKAHRGLVAVLFIDVDRFKQANDTLGHDIGDQLLREVGKRLNQTVRGSDTVARGEAGDAKPAPTGVIGAVTHSVARLGGDEFIVLLTEITGPDDVARVVERLLEAIRQPIHFGSQELFVTASVGVSLYPNHGDDVDTLIRMADIAMYVVKDSGRNGWQMFDDAMNAATSQRWRLETSLHRALERNELVLHYQPKVDAETGAIVGAEALMRWQRDGELIPPAQFISVAEESGLIVPITEWAIDEVCRRLVAWSEAGVRPVPVSINISSRHIQRASLIEPVQRALATSALSADLIELELTETVLMQNIEQALPLLQALKRLGVSISIDDFGTGYSSLSYLKRLPIDTLKIDRSFVRELESSDDNAAIVTAIIAMGRSLHLRVVAEGVETRYQMRRLHEQGCRLMQGWLFAKAVDADAFLELLRTRGAGSDWRHDGAGPEPAVIGGRALGLPEVART